MPEAASPTTRTGFDEPEYIVRLVKQVITVSLETVKIVNALPPLMKDDKVTK